MYSLTAVAELCKNVTLLKIWDEFRYYYTRMENYYITFNVKISGKSSRK
jgi:hypothetical protein